MTRKIIRIIKKPIIWKTTNFICYLVLIIAVLLCTFKSHIMPYYFRIRFKSPVEFHNVKITFPKGIIYSVSKKSIGFSHWENSNGFLLVRKIDLSKMTKEYLIQFFKKKNFHILEAKDISFKDYPSFTISYVDTSWKYNKGIYIIPRNLCVTYDGTRENHKEFKDIIDNMEFLDENQQSKRSTWKPLLTR